MAEILKFKKKKASEKHKGKSLCRSGFHKWETDRQTVFDSQQGKLVTREHCKRCGATRIRAL